MKAKMTSIFKEIVVDNFAGGGGASTGIALAIGRSVDVAINHDPDAIAMHTVNHPDTEHYCESVWNVDPREATKGRPVGLCWFSPDCKHFSKAKGGKPVEKKIRGLAWVTLRWAATVQPRVIMLENVEEFQTWGPLLKDGKPDPKKKGITFKSFVNALKRHGYKVEWRELRACDYGAPTIRKRLFLIARCDGKKIVWPKPTHGHPGSPEVERGKLKPWRTAAEIIDWSLPCPSIFERKKPLAENTLRRIARGIQKFVINNPEPFIIKVNHHGADFRGQEIDEPLQTITAKNGWGVVTPVIMNYKFDNEPEKSTRPLSTITSVNGHCLVTPFVAQIGHTGFSGDRKQYQVDNPLTTVVSKAEHLLVAPTLIQMGYGERPGQDPRVLDIHRPLGTVTAGGNKFALATAYISRQFGNSVGHTIDKPLGTVTAGGGGKSQLVAAFLAKHYGGNYTGPGAGVDEPVPTVTTVDHNALVTSHMIKLRGTCQHGQPMDDPAPTITAGGLHTGIVASHLLKYYGTDQAPDMMDPLHTVTTKDRFGLVETEMQPDIFSDKQLNRARQVAHMLREYGLWDEREFVTVEIDGITWIVVDIGMRMLEPRELFAAQGFPADYIIDIDCNGKRYSKAKQVARCGNAVPPQFAEALVRVNLPELCEEWTIDQRYAEG